MENQELKTIIDDVQEKTLGIKHTPHPIELFGVECGKGWYPLVEKAIGAVARYNGVNRHDPDLGPVEFVQIKEKFGMLCLYLNYYPTEYLHDELRSIEYESLGICENCGSTENVRTQDIHGWTYTYCDKCAKAEEKRLNEFYGKHISREKENKEGTNKETT